LSNFSDKILSFNPIAYYRLGESAGTVAVDETGNFDGTYENSPSLQQSSLVPSDNLSKSVGFNGLDQGINLPSNISANISDEISIVIIADSINTQINQNIIVINDNGLFIIIRNFSSGNLQLFFGGSPNANINITLTNPTDKLLIVLTGKDGGNITAYIDGIKIGSTASSGWLDLPLQLGTKIGTSRQGGFNFFNGNLAECSIFAKELSEVDISEIYDVYLAGQVPTNPLLELKLDETVGTVALDEGGVHTGTYSGSFSLAQPRLSTNSLDSTGNSVSFNGGKIEVPHHYKLANLIDFTILATLSFTNSAASTIASKANAVAPEDGFAILTNAGTITFRQSTAAADSLDSETLNLNDGIARRYAFIRRGLNLEIWINGNLDSSKVITVAKNATELIVMTLMLGTTGNLDNFEIATSPISEAQVRQDFFNEFSFSPYARQVLDFKPDAYWQLGEGSGTLAKDETGRFNGTYVGSPTLGGTGLLEDDSGTSVAFNGSGQYMTLSKTTAQLNYSLLPFSISLTFNANDVTPTQTQRLFSSSGSGDNKIALLISISSSALFFNLFSNGMGVNGLNASTISKELYSNQTNHVVFTHDGSTSENGFNIYLNGVEQTKARNPFGTVYTGMVGTDLISLARRDDFVDDYYNGSLQHTAIYPTELSETQAFELFKKFRLTFPYPEKVLSLSPEIYYRLGETAGTIALDSLGLSQGTYVNTPTLNSPSLLVGDVDPSVTFNGSNQHVVIPDIGDLASFSLSGLFKTSVLKTQRIISSEGASLWAFRLNASGFASFLVGLPTLTEITGSTSLSDNLIHHFVATRNGTELKIYIDGLEVVTGVSSGSTDITTNAPVYIGALSPSLELFDGSLDEIKLFRYPLNSVEVSDLYALTLKGVLPEVEDNTYSTNVKSLNPAIYYRQEEITGITAIDSSGNSHPALYFESPDQLASSLKPFITTGTGTAFDGVDQYLMTSSPRIGVVGDMTISGFINYNNSAIETILGVYNLNGSLANPSQLKIASNSGGLVEIVFRPTQGSTSGGTLALAGTSSGNIYHITATYKASTGEFKAYLNGVFKSSVITITGGFTGTPDIGLVIGGRYHSGTIDQFSDCTVDDVAYFDSELTATQVKNLYNAALSPIFVAVNDKNPSQYWRMDAAAGDEPNVSVNSSLVLVPTGSPSLQQTGLFPADIGSFSVEYSGTARHSALNSSVLNNPNDISFSFGLKLNAFDSGVLSATADLARSLYSLKITSSGNLLYTSSDTGAAGQKAETFAFQFQLSVPYFIVFIKDRVNLELKLYVDGVLESITTPDENWGEFPGTPNLRVGSIFNGASVEYLTGNIDELALYDRALTHLEASELSTALQVSAGVPKIEGIISESKEVETFTVTSHRLSDNTETAKITGISKGLFILDYLSSEVGIPQVVTVIPEYKGNWVAGFAYTVDDIIFPSSPTATPLSFKCLLSGISAAVEPNYNTTIGAITSDGTTSWLTLEPLLQPITNSPLIPSI